MGRLTITVRRSDPTMIVRNGQIVARIGLPQNSGPENVQVVIEAPDDVVIERPGMKSGRRVTTGETIEAFEQAMKR